MSRDISLNWIWIIIPRQLLAPHQPVVDALWDLGHVAAWAKIFQISAFAKALPKHCQSLPSLEALQSFGPSFAWSFTMVHVVLVSAKALVWRHGVDVRSNHQVTKVLKSAEAHGQYLDAWSRKVLLKLMSQIVSRHVLANFRNFMTLTTPFVPELNFFFSILMPNQAHLSTKHKLLQLGYHILGSTAMNNILKLPDDCRTVTNRIEYGEWRGQRGLNASQVCYCISHSGRRHSQRRSQQAEEHIRMPCTGLAFRKHPRRLSARLDVRKSDLELPGLAVFTSWKSVFTAAMLCYNFCLAAEHCNWNHIAHFFQPELDFASGFHKFTERIL